MENNKTLQLVNYQTNGDFTFSVNRKQNADNVIQLQNLDSSKHYINNVTDIQIPSVNKYPLTTKNLGNLILTTKSGTGCIGALNLNACFKSLENKRGQIKVNVFDTKTNEKLSGVSFDFKNSHSLTTSNWETMEGNSGLAAKNLAYGPWLIQTRKSKYIDSKEILMLDTESEEVNLYMTQVNSRSIEQIVYIRDQLKDKHLNLMIKSKGG